MQSGCIKTMTEYSTQERILGEIKSDSAWLAFCCYRDLPMPRTLKAAQMVYEAHKGTKRQSATRHFSRWRREHFWDERIAAEELRSTKAMAERLADRATDEVYAAIEEDSRIVAQLNKGGRANNIQSTQITQSLIKYLLDRCKVKDCRTKEEYAEHIQYLQWQASQVKVIASALREVRSCDKATFEIEGLIMTANDRIYGVAEMLARHEEKMSEEI